MTLLSPPSASPHVERLRRSALHKSVWIGCGVALVVVLIVASVVLGAREVTFSDVVSALQGSHDSIGEAAVAKRIPRTVLALLVGAALAMSGAVMQGVTRNPLADPGLLGVSSGASLAVVIGICFFGLAHPMSFMAVAIVGAALAAVFVYSIGSIGRSGATPLRLALAGAAASAAFISLTSAIMLPRVDLLRTFQFWIIGSVGGADWESIAAVLPLLGIGALVCVLCARSLNSLALGDSLAVGLGVRVGRARLVSSLGAVILCGAATAIAGPIGFVGLVIPHLCRLLVGPDHRWLLPFSAIVGAALLLAADVLGRIVARPAEIEVGIVVALLGAPFFIWIVRRQKVREL